MNILRVRNFLRIIVVSSAMLFSMGTAAAFASNVELTGDNYVTGPHSDNQNEWHVRDHVDINVDNNSDVDNDRDIDVQTGENDIDCNTLVDNVSTGDISGQIDVSNEIDNGVFELPVPVVPSDPSFDFSNDTTGSNSRNENRAYVDMNTDIDVNNRTDINNRLDLDANTGHNQIQHNTEVGDIETGSIRFSADTNNEVNQNSGFQLEDFQNGDVTGEFSNELTGCDSENKNTADVSQETDVNIDNNVDINNHTDIDANTGHNDVEDNTVVGDISTGDVEIDITTTNTTN